MSSLLPPFLVLARRFMPAAVGCLAIGVGWHATLALANPTAGVVVSGSASFTASANKSLIVTNTPGAIINWQSFSIGAGEATRFQQQSAASTVLNRVRDSDPAMILGTLSGNGRAFVISPNGMPGSLPPSSGSNISSASPGATAGQRSPGSLSLAKREASF